jgi:predicted  nucleic acid-binding Zn-ribbon protein
MIFKTKGELLEYLGEDKKYVRLIDRMMVKWEVNKTPDGYEYIDKDREEIERLKLEVQRLTDEIEELKDEKSELEADYIKWIQEHPAGRGVDNNNKVNTLTEVSDLEYLNNEYIKLEENREQALRKCYEFMVGKKIFDKEKNPFEDFFRWATWEDLT